MRPRYESVESERLIKRLGFGARFWNLRRQEDPDTRIALDGAKLDGLILTGIDFSNASLRGASMHATNLMNADLRGARLTNASYSPADLEGALNVEVRR